MDCNTLEPRVGAFTAQRVSVIGVLQRCRANYQNKQWDEGACLLYDRERALQLVNYPVPPVFVDQVGQCLLDAESDGVSNLACMQDYIARTQVKSSRLIPTETQDVD